MNLQEIIYGDTFYWFCALTGSGIFTIHLLLNLIGIGEFDNFDNVGMSDAGQIKWISVQTLTGFLMMFGWTALTCQKEFGIDGPLMIAIALTAGAIAIYIIAMLLRFTAKMHSRGTVFNIDSTIGLEALVYHRIPVNGVGKITVCIENFTREIDALSKDQHELTLFSKVKIIQKIDDKTVLVIAI